MIHDIMANASSASLPGITGSHTSAFEALRPWRGSTTYSFMPRSRATDRRGASHDGPLFAVMGSVPQMIRHSQWSMSAYMRLWFVVGCVRTLAMTPVMPHTPPWLKLLTEPNPSCVKRSPMRNMRSPPAEQNRLDLGPRSGCSTSISLSAHFAAKASLVISPDSTSATSASTCFFGA